MSRTAATSPAQTSWRVPSLRAIGKPEPHIPLQIASSSGFRVFLRQHHERVGELSRIVALALDLGDEHADAIAKAAALHDVGKVFVPEAILQQPRALTEDEQLIVRRHSFWGFIALKRSQDPVMQLAATVALQHHECWDGTGYPFGLAGEDIAIEARIVSICDVYDALRAERPYKVGLSHEQAMRKIVDGDERVRPAMFDPSVLNAFEAVQRACCRRFEAMRVEI